MGYFQQIEKISANHFVLPRIKDMKCQVDAFLSQELLDQTVAKGNEDLWQQAVDSASYEGAIGMYLMPDTHLGYGIPVGGVLVTENTIVQSGSGYDISCFTGDTQVSLVDGREMTFAQLVQEYGDGGEFYVYSMTPEGRVTAGRAHSPRRTRQNASLVEVEFDNGETVQCTPDHEFMLRDGSYREASELRWGDSLMPLYRSYPKGYCDVQHPADNTTERMYKVAFREAHGYVPEWPRVVHHDIFSKDNLNPSKTNDDPRFLVEMDQHDHWKLHSETARARLDRGEIWGAKAHKLYPEMYSKMGSENMTRLHVDPAFQKRRDLRMAENHRKARVAGKFKEHDAKAGQRGRTYLIAHNQSDEGRAQSRQNGLKNRGRVRSDATRRKLRNAHAEARKELLSCPHCEQECRGKGGLGRHVFHKHTEKPPVVCPHCSRSCKSKTGLAVHVRHAHNNHKVVAVRHLTETADVYCLTVEKYQNFALTAGVFVHNCGVVYLRVPGLTAADVVDWDKRLAWVREVEKRVATGIGNDRPHLAKKINYRQIEDVLRYGAKAIGVSADVCERQFIPVPEDVDLHKIEKARAKCTHQLGSVGGGNHFIEMQVDRDDGAVWVMIHCGSRGYGWQTANHFFYEGGKLRGLPKNRREQSHLFMDEDLGKEYWAYHNSAANFAVANRHTIVEGVNAALRETYGVEGKVYYEISHNLVQEETLVLPDGSTKKGFVHRKGATRAFPAGHPDLVGTKWAETGHPCCIPGSMLAGAAILFPKEGAYKSGCSVNHGSGRSLGRAEAKRELREIHDDIDAEMHDIVRYFGPDKVKIVGVVGNTPRTPLDECHHAYKDLDAVLQVLVDEGIATIAHRMFPVANIKGVDS